MKIQYKKENILLIDGVRINTLLGWYLIRASNTENAIIIRVEAQRDSDKMSLLNEVIELLKEQGLNLDFEDE